MSESGEPGIRETLPPVTASVLARVLAIKQVKLIEMLKGLVEVHKPLAYHPEAIDELALKIAREWHPQIKINSKGEFEIIEP